MAHSGKFRKVITIYATLIIVLFAIPLLGQLSPLVSIPVILVLMTVALWAVGAAFGLGFSKH